MGYFFCYCHSLDLKKKVVAVIFARLGKAQVNLALLSPFAKIRPLSRLLKPYHPLKKRNGMVKCQINQIAALIKVSILKAAHREAVGSAVGAHAGIAAEEVEAA